MLNSEYSFWAKFGIGKVEVDGEQLDFQFYELEKIKYASPSTQIILTFVFIGHIKTSKIFKILNEWVKYKAF